MTTNIRMSITEEQAQLLLQSLNDRTTRLAADWHKAPTMTQKDALGNEMRKLEALASFLGREVRRPDQHPAARRMEYRVTLCRANQHEVTTSYPYSQEPSAMDHMASYAAAGYAFRVEFQ